VIPQHLPDRSEALHRLNLAQLARQFICRKADLDGGKICRAAEAKIGTAADDARAATS
jgi:hypothetical protein